MKRSNLTRKTPLRRKKPMNRVSEKTKQVKADTDQPRKDFVLAVGCCMVEGCTNPPQETTHEITCGNGRTDALYSERMQMAVCVKHHNEFHNKPYWTKERQLRERVKWELQQFCDEFNDFRGFARTAFTVDDLMDYLMF